MRVLIAPDSFKGSLGAAAVAAALAEGWLSVRPGDQVTRLPLADGGEGTLDVLATTVSGARWHRAKVTGPGGAPVTARWLELPSGSSGLQGRGNAAPAQLGRGAAALPFLGAKTAVVELARASGLPLLARPDPMRAQTTGLGELLGRALDAGMGRILVGLGGSASTDGGTGALAALGARFLNAKGQSLPPGGGTLADLVSADLTHLRPPPPGGVSCLTDVTAPLLGARGAAAVFGPQKGADEGQIARLEAGLARLAEMLGGEPDAPGAGAAGGTGYGLAAAWGAQLTSGAAELGRLAGLDRALTDADLVITGEGRFDETSMAGKTCGTVIAAAAAAGVPVAVVAGQASNGIMTREPGHDGIPALTAVLTLAGLAGETAGALASPRRWLRRAGGRLASDAGAESSPRQPENYQA
ncbi:MAG TPA: glycerate kinase [Streptosporangiaceae bacterium]|nr:glycerate kinase [Streptosporangiaceae bacterium]